MTPQTFTVYDMIARGADVYGDAPPRSSTASGRSRSASSRDRVDALAAGLAALGIARGDRICILAQNDPAYLELYGACARQGIVAYPINWRLTGPEVERVVERATPKMFVADASTLAVVAGWPASKTAVPHWYQLGETPAPGFHAAGLALSGRRATAGRRRGARRRLRRDLHRGGRRRSARRRPHPRQRADRQPHGHRRLRLHRRPIAISSRCRCSTSPHSGPRWRTCTPAAPAWWCHATTPRRRCA